MICIHKDVFHIRLEDFIHFMIGKAKSVEVYNEKKIGCHMVLLYW